MGTRGRANLGEQWQGGLGMLMMMSAIPMILDELSSGLSAQRDLRLVAALEHL
jgi:hypothetical protein